MKTIPLRGKRGEGRETLVDDADHARLAQFKWTVNQYGYVCRISYHRRGYYDYERKTIAMHREVLMPRAGYEVDHKNGDKLDNRKHNLRPATRAENCRNRPRRKSTGYKGVYWRKANSNWWAAIIVDYKQINLGVFTDPAEAAKAYNQAALKYHGEFANLNKL